MTTTMSVNSRHSVISIFFCLCFVFNGVLSQYQYDSPAAAAAGLKIRTNESAFDDVFRSLVRSAFKGDIQKPMPDESGSMPMSIFGNVDYKITNIQARDFKPPEFKMTIRPDKVSVALTVTGFTLVGKWTYKHSWFGAIKDSGSVNATVTVSSVVVSLAVGFDRSAGGRPVVSVAECSVNVSSVAVRLSGGASWLYNLFFTGTFAKSSVEGKVRANVCAQVRRCIDVDAAAKIASEPLQRDLGNDLVIDLGLMSSPTLGVGYVECTHNGTVFDRNNPMKPPIQPGPFPAIDDSTELKSISLWVSDFVPGSCAYALYSRGTMRSTVTPATMPQSMRWFLNTTCPKDVACAGNYFPQVAAKYPSSVLEVEFAVTSWPMVSVTPSGLLVVTMVNVTVRVRRADGVPMMVCSFEMTVNTSAMVYMNGSQTKIEVSRILPKVISVTSSTVGAINNGDLSVALESLARLYLQMEKVEKAFPSPAVPDFFRFKNWQLNTLYRWLLLTGDVETVSPN